MANIYTSVEQLIGHTPLLRLMHMEETLGLKAQLLVKLERFNPGGSAKDRVAMSMLNTAEAKGEIGPGSVIIEPTSGNTGIGLAMLCAVRGYRCIIVMPSTMSIERQKLMLAYGAELVLCEGGMPGAIAKAEELKASIPGAVIAGQFVNPANSAAHEATTGPEIWEDTDGAVDAFVAGVGTGGTITGTAHYLQQQKPETYVLAVEPKDSPVLSGGKAGAHGLQGIGAGFVPNILDTACYDEIMTVTTEEAFEAARSLGKQEGILAGISSGAALHAGIELAKREEMAGKTIVVLLPDTGERYLSIDLF